MTTTKTTTQSWKQLHKEVLASNPELAAMQRQWDSLHKKRTSTMLARCDFEHGMSDTPTPEELAQYKVLSDRYYEAYEAEHVYQRPFYAKVEKEIATLKKRRDLEQKSLVNSTS